MSEIIIRDYQEEMINVVMTSIPHDSFILVQASTGAGKTIFFSELTKRLLSQWSFLRIGILAHRGILIEQARDKMLIVWTDAPIGIASAGIDKSVDIEKPIMIGTIQTLVKRVNDTVPYDVIFIDEAHRLPPKNHQSQYKTWLDTMLKYNPQTRIIGLTATPYRLGHGYIYGTECKKGNENWFPTLHYKIGIHELQAKGFLCGYRAKATVDIEDELSTVKVDGEFNLHQLSDVMCKEIHIGSAVKAYEKYASDRKRVIVFGVTIDHAEKLMSAFKESGYVSSCIHSKLPHEERTKILNDFDNNQINILCSVGVLTEGFDSEAVDCIIMCRPTKSAALHVQMCGRGLRIFEDKQDVLILDLSNNFKTHGDIADPKVIIPSDKIQDVLKKQTKACPQCEEVLNLNVRECPVCGYQYPEKEVVEKHDSPELIDIDFMKPSSIVVYIKNIEIDDYTSRAGNRMVRLSMKCSEHKDGFGTIIVNHFFMFDPDANDYARRKSQIAWHTIVGNRYPNDTDEALDREGELFMSMPNKIKIIENGKFWNVVDWNVGEDEVEYDKAA